MGRATPNDCGRCIRRTPPPEFETPMLVLSSEIGWSQAPAQGWKAACDISGGARRAGAPNLPIFKLGLLTMVLLYAGAPPSLWSSRSRLPIFGLTLTRTNPMPTDAVQYLLHLAGKGIYELVGSVGPAPPRGRCGRCMRRTPPPNSYLCRHRTPMLPRVTGVEPARGLLINLGCL